MALVVQADVERLPASFDDWAGSSRGSHVEFESYEPLPLEQGEFLGHGVNGPVHATTIRGVAVAWKIRYCRRGVGVAERKEIEILKKLTHKHIVRLVGTYSRESYLGLLTWPVAICDMATFFEDMDVVFDGEKEVRMEMTNTSHYCRLNALKSLSNTNGRDMSRIAWRWLGCLARAIEYLHSQNIRHKDLKPSNILLGSRNQIWLTDFGSSTDFSLLSSSATDNGERGTPKYFAPEVASYQVNGRAADIFSLGCVFVEIINMAFNRTIKHLRALRPDLDASYQANINRLDSWFPPEKELSVQTQYLVAEINGMLSVSPEDRPIASQVVERLIWLHRFTNRYGEQFFGLCCMESLITRCEHNGISGPLAEGTEDLKTKHEHVVGRPNKGICQIPLLIPPAIMFLTTIACYGISGRLARRTEDLKTKHEYIVGWPNEGIRQTFVLMALEEIFATFIMCFGIIGGSLTYFISCRTRS